MKARHMDGTPAVQHHEKSIIRASDADMERAVFDKTGRRGKNAYAKRVQLDKNNRCDYNDAHRHNMKVSFSKFPVSIQILESDFQLGNSKENQ